MTLFGFPPAEFAAAGLLIYLYMNPLPRPSNTFYLLYSIISSIVITYLVTIPSPEFLEKIQQMPSNTTHTHIVDTYRQTCDESGYYEYNTCNLWWKAAIFFIIIGSAMQCFTR